ncbi:MAG: DEAD/DEAH box helicase [Candidatus Omnitrophica bacterium]|nr:DEAD/DEAH box helicase [Candidatus Omnitrophota bacterium]
MHPFTYDRFQQEAIEAILGGTSVFVSAPTGAGKTVIAEVAVAESLKSKGMAIYTAPIKALSNQKFRDFHAQYGERVGILTGDVTLNPEAPLLIMTTEIYRNSLLERKGRFANCRWVIFDEIHYLDDPERGTVWEEALLLTPRETEILALSATIPNAEQLAAWIQKIHGRPVKVVQETHRPVPLKVSFQCQNELYSELDSLKAHGYRGREQMTAGRRPFRMRRSRGGKFYFRNRSAPTAATGDSRGRANRADQLLRQIQTAGRLPCLYFAFSRKRVEELAWEFAALNLISPESKAPLLNKFDELCERYQIRHERSAWEMRELIAQGAAYHHAGLLPTLKEVVEIVFSSRLIPVIVTTETFALGVNMPARSVVLDTLSRRTGGPKEILRVRELSQMAGRAGRRGMDEAGFVYLRINPWEVPFPRLIHLMEGKPEQVSSRFGLTYATLLNLYRTHSQDLLGFYQKTLHAFQASAPIQREAYSLIERKVSLLQKWGYLYPAGKLSLKGEFALSIYGYELILSELFADGVLDSLPLIDLGILLLALVYEPRRGTPPARLPHRLRGLAEKTQNLLDRIHQEERRLRISPLTKGASFHLSQAMERWCGGAAFDKVVPIADVAEGELIRYFRMTVQLYRALQAAPAASRALKEKAHRLLKQVNRDPVDAEAELRRSL